MAPPQLARFTSAAVFAAQVAFAQCGNAPCLPTSTPPPATKRINGPPEWACRIQVANGDGVGYGSGVLVQVTTRYSLVLTCNHLFVGTGDRIEVTFAGSNRFAATTVASDRFNDVAVLLIAPINRRPATLHLEHPPAWLTASGFGGDGRFRAVHGPVTGHATPVGATQPSLRIRGAVRSGDSGGPVTDGQGRVIGVVWGVRNGETYATVGQPIRSILATARRRLSNSNRSPPREVSTPQHAETQLDAESQDLLSGLRQLSLRLNVLEEKQDGRRECPCQGTCVQPGDLAKYALRSEIDALTGRHREAVRSDRYHASAIAQAAATAFGLGSPVGLALLASHWFIRRRKRDRKKPNLDGRGAGGPRDTPFQRSQSHADPTSGQRDPLPVGPPDSTTDSR